ncbi:uncharacterized protein LOC142929762 isoform X2 [Petromyzon marinus]|uniref:uncharacterized protein LOC142929762 isoform X2 n=1 Tax=Petromyzon marinus TaxID=7757 RepID=UPI003F700136
MYTHPYTDTSTPNPPNTDTCAPTHTHPDTKTPTNPHTETRGKTNQCGIPDNICCLVSSPPRPPRASKTGYTGGGEEKERAHRCANNPLVLATSPKPLTPAQEPPQMDLSHIKATLGLRPTPGQVPSRHPSGGSYRFGEVSVGPRMRDVHGNEERGWEEEEEDDAQGGGEEDPGIATLLPSGACRHERGTWLPPDRLRHAAEMVKEAKVPDVTLACPTAIASHIKSLANAYSPGAEADCPSMMNASHASSSSSSPSSSSSSSSFCTSSTPSPSTTRGHLWPSGWSRLPD